MKVVAIVQARMGSTRLPGKVLRRVVGKAMLEHIIERLGHAKMLDEIAIATSDNEQDKPIMELAKKTGVSCYAGSEYDVLDRYLGAAELTKANVIVRITGDCPLIDPDTVDDIIRVFLNENADYARTVIDERDSKSFPRGLDVEVLSMEVLRRIHELAEKPYQREHVTPFIHENPELFKIVYVEAEDFLRRPEYRLCVDTIEDLRLIREIYNRLYRGKGIIDIGDAIRLIDHEPELCQINAKVRQKTLHEE